MTNTNKQLKNKQDWKLYYLEKNITKLDYAEFTKILNEIDFQSGISCFVSTDYSAPTPSKVEPSSNIEEAAGFINIAFKSIITVGALWYLYLAYLLIVDTYYIKNK